MKPFNDNFIPVVSTTTMITVVVIILLTTMKLFISNAAAVDEQVLATDTFKGQLNGTPWHDTNLPTALQVISGDFTFDEAGQCLAVARLNESRPATIPELEKLNIAERHLSRLTSAVKKFNRGGNETFYRTSIGYGCIPYGMTMTDTDFPTYISKSEKLFNVFNREYRDTLYLKDQLVAEKQQYAEYVEISKRKLPEAEAAVERAIDNELYDYFTDVLSTSKRDRVTAMHAASQILDNYSLSTDVFGPGATLYVGDFEYTFFEEDGKKRVSFINNNGKVKVAPARVAITVIGSEHFKNNTDFGLLLDAKNTDIKTRAGFKKRIAKL